MLETACLVKVEPRGTRRVYAITPEGLDDLRQYVETLWSDALAAYADEIRQRQSHEEG